MAWSSAGARSTYFCNNFCQVLSGEEDADVGSFQALAGRKSKSPSMFQNERLVVVLKARQLGLTWLAVAYALWSMMFHPIATVLALLTPG